MKLPPSLEPVGGKIVSVPVDHNCNDLKHVFAGFELTSLGFLALRPLLRPPHRRNRWSTSRAAECDAWSARLAGSLHLPQPLPPSGFFTSWSILLRTLRRSQPRPGGIPFLLFYLNSDFSGSFPLDFEKTKHKFIILSTCKDVCGLSVHYLSVSFTSSPAMLCRHTLRAGG
jgi:hypothetical protein